jgi:hypothetical protein
MSTSDEINDSCSNTLEKLSKLSRQYDTRATPRRRSKAENGDDQPIFLKKAFAMISNCPKDIGLSSHRYFDRVSIFFTGGWSEDGETVVIRDVKRFEETIIPTMYKHNNFSSFVRQLNFCKDFPIYIVIYLA